MGKRGKITIVQQRTEKHFYRLYVQLTRNLYIVIYSYVFISYRYKLYIYIYTYIYIIYIYIYIYTYIYKYIYDSQREKNIFKNISA